jgi:hypothetical protein
MIVLLALLTVVVIAITAWLSTPAMVPPAPISPVVERDYNRFFADEAAYAPTAADYANLMLDENYLPLPQSAVPAAPAVAAPPIQPAVVRWQNRIFADEAAYTPTAADYANLMLSDSYLPLPAAGQPARVAPQTNRIFLDEIAGAAAPQTAAGEPDAVEPIVPLHGPR